MYITYMRELRGRPLASDCHKIPPDVDQTFSPQSKEKAKFRRATLSPDLRGGDMPKSIAPAVIPAAVVCPRCERAGRVVEIMGGHYNVLGSRAHVVGIDRAEVAK